jgi:hypothetical protein
MGCHLDTPSNASAAMEESAAKKMGAVTTTLSTCHMSILEEPAKIAGVIDEAAKMALAI